MDVDTQTHLKTLRDMLGYRLGELRAEVNAARAAREARDAQAGTAEVGDQKDLANQWAQAEVGDAEAQRDLQELALIEQALQRLDAGTYGDCLQCGEPIPLARLYVHPAAPRCAACQAKVERAR